MSALVYMRNNFLSLYQFRQNLFPLPRSFCSQKKKIEMDVELDVEKLWCRYDAGLFLIIYEGFCQFGYIQRKFIPLMGYSGIYFWQGL